MRILAILADGLGYFSYNRLKEKFKDIFEDVIPLRSYLSYSLGLHPTIWWGITPQKHGFWSRYRYNGRPISENGDAKKGWCRWVWKLLLRKFLRELHLDFFQHEMLSSLSAPFSSYFDEVPENPEAPSEDHPLSIFTFLEQSGIRWRYEFAPDSADLASKVSDGTHGPDVSVFLYGAADSLGHQEGPISERRTNEIIQFLSAVERADEKYDAIFVFSDHGMFPIENRLNLMEILLSSLGRGEKNFLTFYDSTIARFWYEEEDARAYIENRLPEDFGTLIPREKFGENAIPENRQIGDIIYVANPRTEIFPNFFHPIYPSYFKGIHGYLPEDKDPFGPGLFASSIPLKKNIGKLEDIAPTLAKVTAGGIGREWDGSPLL